MPQFDLSHLAEASERGFADVAAPRLTAFVNSLRLPADTELVPVAHSYGASVLGGAEYLGLRADRVVYVAPAGLGHNVDGVDYFPETSDVPHFVLQARNDGVVGWNQGVSGLGSGHGLTNPLWADDVIRLETGYLDADNPGGGTIESSGSIESHSSVFTPGSTSMRNITSAVEGKPVALYHPDDLTIRGGFAPVAVSDPGSGAAHPEELISPITLKDVNG